MNGPAHLPDVCLIHKTSSRVKVPRRESGPKCIYRVKLAQTPPLWSASGVDPTPILSSGMCVQQGVRRVLRYLKASIDPEDRKSVLGCYCLMGVALGSWSNRKQRTFPASIDNAKTHSSRPCLEIRCVNASLLKRGGLGRDRKEYVKR